MNKGLRSIIIISSLLFAVSMICVACKDKETQTIYLSEETSNKEISVESENITDDNEVSYTDIFVYVTGQVKKPGVYQVKESARLYEVIELAGGFTDKASRDCINLAQKVTDGQQVNVLSKSEYRKIQNNDGSNQNSAEQSRNNNESDSVSVNINTATVEELMTLPGIGESKASAIVEYRKQNGMFAVPEDIMKVPGIKETAFSKIKSLIKI